MRQATIPTAWGSTVRATLTNRFMILAFLVVLQTQLVSSVSAEVTFLNTWGSNGSGDGEFDQPHGIALSYTGQVYVTDRNNNRIQRFDADGNYQLQWGSFGSGDGEFDWPHGIALSDTGQVYVTDRNNDRIQRFDADGNYQLQWGSFGSGDGEFAYPYDITLSDTGQAYVTDQVNNRIQRFDADGNYQLQWGSLGSGDGEFIYPLGVALSGTDQVYVVDLGNNRIHRFDADGNYQMQWGGFGSGEGEFNKPLGIALSDADQVYVTEISNSRIQRFDADGNYQLQWGGYGTRDGDFSNPSSITITPTGQVYVVDRNNDRIQRFFDSEAWVSGTNTFVNGSAGPTSVAVGPGGILGTSLTLDASKGLVVGDTTTVNAGGTLSISGGSLTTGSFSNSGTGGLNFYDGTLTVNGAGGSFDPGAGEFTIDGQIAADLPALVITGTATATLPDKLIVGFSNRATLTVGAGGVVSNNNTGYVGYGGSSTGVVTVSELGSQWNNSSNLVVGFSGDGTLDVTDGGAVSNNSYSAIGYNFGSSGEATVSGSDSHWSTSGALYVGRSGEGTLNVEAGGEVNNIHGFLGRYLNSTGEATVTGPGSQWNNSSLTVGGDGNATLTIENDGLVTVGGTTTIGSAGMVNLTGGRFEFGQTTFAEFSTINAISGAMAGNVVITGVHDVASLTALQNPTVDLSEVAAANEDLLYGSAILKSSLDNRTAGELRAMGSDWVRFEGDGNINAGEINNFGGQVDFAQDMTNQGGGEINNFDGSLLVGGTANNHPNAFIGGRGQFVANGGWTNEGAMIFSGTTDILGNVVNTAGGQIITLGSATTTIFNDLEHNGQEIRTGAGSRTVIFGTASGSGPYTGDGTVEMVFGFSPGNSPGAVSFDGDLVLASTATTLMELAGVTDGDYDQLQVAGILEVGGGLAVELLDGFVPTADADFQIFDAGTLSGTFSAVLLPDLPSMLGWDSSHLYSSGTLSVIPEPATLPLLALGMLLAWRKR